jgi:hypothetical protein
MSNHKWHTLEPARRGSATRHPHPAAKTPPPGAARRNGTETERNLPGEFDLDVPAMTAWEDAGGQMRFLGVASSTGLDRQGDRMTPAALHSMAATAPGIPLLSDHHATPGHALGVVETGWTDGQTFRVAGTLHSGSPEAWVLMKRLQAGHRYGLSVGGRILQAEPVHEDAVAGPVRQIHQVALEHLALCAPEEAVNPEARLEAGGERREASRETAGERQPDHDSEAETGEWPVLPEAELVARVEELRRLVTALQEQLHQMVTGEPPVLPETGERPVLPAQPGRRQSLPLAGPERSSRAQHDPQNLWKGVL